MLVVVIFVSVSRRNVSQFQIQNLSIDFCNFPSFFICFNLINSSPSSLCVPIFLLSFFFFFFQIFFWRYPQLISFPSFSVANLSRKQQLLFECMFLFLQSEIRYFILQQLSLLQNDSSKLPFANVRSTVYCYILKKRTLRLQTLN